MNKLEKGDKAPRVTAQNYLGKEINLEDYKGKRVLLSFHVFASCPFCNLRINELKKKYENEWNTNEFEMIHVFPSHGTKIAEFAGKNNPPYQVLADPKKKIYKAFGLKTSIIGMVVGFLNIKRLAKAFRVVNIFTSLTNNDAALHQMPADFLIDEKGFIQEAHYGKNTSDNLPIEQIEMFMYKRLRVA